MDDNSIRRYAGLMHELGLTGMEVKENGVFVRLERGAQARPRIDMDIEEAVPEKPVSVPQPAPVKTEAKPASGLTEIESPLVGVFYAAPAEDAEPFVKVGDHVKKGDVLCVIEAMKLMNELMSDEDGTIEEICVENAEIVDFGRVLFRIRKD